MDLDDAWIFPDKSTDSGSGTFLADGACAIKEDAADMVAQKEPIDSGEDAVVETEPAIPNDIEPCNALKDDVKLNRLLIQSMQKQMSEKFRDCDRRHDDQEEAILADSRGMKHLSSRVDALKVVLKDVKHLLVDVVGYNVVDSQRLASATAPADGDGEVQE